MIDPGEFESILVEAVKRLNTDVRDDTERKYQEPKAFEEHVLEVLQAVTEGRGIKTKPSFHPHAFPDIVANGFGVEVKSTTKESWLTVGNSVFEGMRDSSVKRLYIVFGKFGGMPAVKWGRYEERITHVRISHAPRFVLEMDRDGASLFNHMDVSYDRFSQLTPDEKMRHIRKYSRDRLKAGENLWWLEDREEGEALPGMVQRIYMHLSPAEKIKLRAEVTLLFPQVVGHGRSKGKYEDVALYLLTAHGVLAPQTRDLFSAGSVAGTTGGKPHIPEALKKLEAAMIEAAETLPDDLFDEYWKAVVPKDERIMEWLRRADGFAKSRKDKWKPSDHLFIKYREGKTAP